MTGITMACGAPLFWIANHWQTLISSRAARREVLDFIAEAENHSLIESTYPTLQPELLSEGTGFQNLSRRKRSKTSPTITPLITAPPKVEYRNVCFGYQPDQMLIENLTTTVKAVSHTLITGPSGYGKSTLANLLLRYDDTLSGEILIEGHKLQEMGDISSFASISRQEAILFSDSFRENLSMRNPEICDDDIFDLLKKVGLEKWANKLSLDKKVETQGENLSGGEKTTFACSYTFAQDAPSYFRRATSQY